MEISLGSTIEKIKREEQNKEEKLKAKRELESVKAAADRSLHDLLAQIINMQHYKTQAIKKIDKLRIRVTLVKSRHDVIFAQLASSKKQFYELKSKTEQATLELQEIRSNFCKVVYAVSDECDVWALLMKPSMEPLALPRATVIKPFEPEADKQLSNERRLSEAKERRDRALAERDRLKSEPETGAEFIRIKNALRYSLGMYTDLRK